MLTSDARGTMRHCFVRGETSPVMRAPEMQADLQEDALLAERLSSHALAGPGQTGKQTAGAASSTSAVGSKPTAVEIVVDSPDPMGMGIIDARTCTLVTDFCLDSCRAQGCFMAAHEREKSVVIRGTWVVGECWKRHFGRRGRPLCA